MHVGACAKVERVKRKYVSDVAHCGDTIKTRQAEHSVTKSAFYLKYPICVVGIYHSSCNILFISLNRYRCGLGHSRV